MKSLNNLVHLCFTLLYLNVCAQDSLGVSSDKQVTIELLLVEYIHEGGFNWGIDIFNAEKGKFSQGSFAPDNSGINLSYVYDTTGSLSEKFKFNLQSLVNNNDALILQNPRVTVKNLNVGKINITEDKYIQLQTASINGLTTKLEKIQVGVNLDVTPTIISDTLINLKVNGKISEFLYLGVGGGEFSVEGNEINTNITMGNDQTLVIGGMIKQEEFNNESGLIFLRRIPLIGKLFSRIEKRVLHKEMVLYMTAYIHNTSDKIDYETKLLNKNLEEDIKKTFQKQFFINL